MKIRKTFIKSRFKEKLETHIQWKGSKKQYPTVVFVSGFGMDLHEYINSFDEIAERLIKEGFLTIQFSFAGTGRSQGDYSETSTSKQAQEIQDVFKYAKKLERVNSERIGIISQSMGVPATILSFPLEIKSLVTISGAVFPIKSLKKVFKERGVEINLKGTTRFPKSDGSVTIIKEEFWQAINGINFPKRLSKFDYPLLVIHGSLDTKIEEENSRQLISEYKGKSRLEIFSKGDHGITDVTKEVRDNFLSLIIDWMNITLKE